MKIALLSFVFAGSLAHAALPPGADADAAGLHERMIGKLQQKLRRELTENELAAFSDFLVLTENVAPSTQFAGPGENPDVTTVMYCAGGKAGLIVKFGMVLCIDKNTNIFRVRTDGMGLSLGIAASGFALVHNGKLNTLLGDYEGVALGAGAQVEGLKKLNEILFKRVGGEVAVMINVQNNSRMYVVGANYGPMIDFAYQKMSIKLVR